MSNSNKRKRTIPVLLRLLEEENDIITRNANNAGFTNSNGEANRQQYILSCVLKKQVKQPAVDKNGALKISEQLRKIGTNLNQLTKNVNMGYIDDCSKELSDLYKEMSEIREYIERKIKLDWEKS